MGGAGGSLRGLVVLFNLAPNWTIEAILSTDAITRKPVAVTSSDGGEAIAIHPLGNLAMAWDHRAFDGAYAASFLREIKEIIETRDWAPELA